MFYPLQEVTGVVVGRQGSCHLLGMVECMLFRYLTRMVG